MNLVLFLGFQFSCQFWFCGWALTVFFAIVTIMTCNQ
ncbi:hypothetical protein BT93_G1936 [Corymbia citriodora subsp. variegata]|nr:hypothetical protein BT93_G1936 [Corymbia citriodora subsp. variegata]